MRPKNIRVEVGALVVAAAGASLLLWGRAPRPEARPAASPPLRVEVAPAPARRWTRPSVASHVSSPRAPWSITGEVRGHRARALDAVVCMSHGAARPLPDEC
ncbi:MAG TPA: hypothetical protein VMG12_03290, partial [Polyangiaceae bacterium]|nr:hypothetical protein [Polyangiaceae bacterium]